MDNKSLDQTSLTTISLLEARLMRIEHLLYGTSAPSTSSQQKTSSSAVTSLVELERRFATLLSRFRVYTDILKLCTLL